MEIGSIYQLLNMLYHVEVDIKQLCSSSIHEYNISMLSHLSDFMKYRRNIKFWSMFFSFLNVNAARFFSQKTFFMVNQFCKLNEPYFVN